MRIIDTTQIVDPGTQQPLIGPSIDFLTQNQLETLGSIVRSQLGGQYNSSTVYVLYGCVVTGVTSGSGTFSMTSGAIFYNGEVYQVAAVSTVTVGVGNAVYSAVNIANTGTDPYDNTRALDPVIFSDGSSKYVHKTRTWLPAVAASGSNAVSTWVYPNIPYLVGQPGAVAYGSGWSDIAFSPNGMAYLQKNNVVTLNGQFKATSASTTTPVFTLTGSFQPLRNYIGFGIVTDLSGTIANGTVVAFSINTSGQVTLNGYSGTISNSFALFMVYPTS